MRKAGILLPISSLPSPHGIGTLGRQAYDFVDFLVAAGQSLWQVLPVGPTGFGDSPYQSFSAMAGNPYFIDLDLLCANGLLTPEEIGAQPWGASPARVDYALLFKRRFHVLALAAARQNKAAPAYRAFCQQNAFWLDDYALYMAIKDAHGHQGLTSWPEALRRRQPEALAAARAQYAPRAEFYRCLQYFFFTQWAALKRYANAAGVHIVGDIPIYVSDDSSDLWAQPELFMLDEAGHMTAVAGVPPDAFSSDGQLWGNPLYNWKAHRRTRYAWWIARLKHSALLYDVTRIDHFRGFAGFYAVPPQDENAKRGRWMKGPGLDFIRAVHRALPHMQIIAEDLGFLTEEVNRLLQASGYPGMKVLQFAFDSREESDYLPHNYLRHTVVYTGTHDNTTLRGWLREAQPHDVAFARRYLGITPRQSLPDAMIRAALSSVADTAIIPLQDWLHLGPDARINIPSTLGGNNWCWRLVRGQLDTQLAAHIRQATRTWGRLSQLEKDKEHLAEQLAKEADTYGTVVPSASAKSAEKLLSMAEETGVNEYKINDESQNKMPIKPAEIGAENAPEFDQTKWAEKWQKIPLRVLTAAQMKAAEEAAVAAGTSFEALMENAGRAAAGGIETLAGPSGSPKSMLLLCGKGNNAGDAFVVARLLAQKGWRAQVLLLCGNQLSPLAQRNWERLPAGVERVDDQTADFTAEVIVDGVFGTGFSGSLPPAVAAAFEKANRAGGRRVALDVPSGLNCDTGAAAPGSFRAARTLTFGAYKPGLLLQANTPLVGEVYCLDIGL